MQNNIALSWLLAQWVPTADHKKTIVVVANKQKALELVQFNFTLLFVFFFLFCPALSLARIWVWSVCRRNEHEYIGHLHIRFRHSLILTRLALIRIVCRIVDTNLVHIHRSCLSIASLNLSHSRPVKLTCHSTCLHSHGPHHASTKLILEGFEYFFFLLWIH